jgi:hypothetical protein
MPTVRHLGLFSLRPTPIVEGPRCAQPAQNFSLPTKNGFISESQLGPPSYSIAPATLPASPYVPLTFEQAMRWHWRIKRWRVKVDVQFRWDGLEDIAPIEGVFFADNFSGQQVIVDEKEKVCEAGRFLGEKSVYSDEEEPLNTLYDWTCSVSIGQQQSVWANYPTTPRLAISQLSQSVRVSDDKKIYYIPVVVGLLIRGLDFLQSYTSGQLFNENQGQDKPLVWSIDDGEKKITRPFRYGGEDGGSVSITVDEYWPYDPLDGLGPIYDSATGAQLRAFPQ